MTNSKATKRALFSSFVSLLLCFTMLMGATFAWFTDNVSSTGNRIQAGNLEVDLVMDKEETGAYASIADGNGDIFSEATGNGINWEPGKTEIVYLGVRNNGSLALKYNILLNVIDEGLIGSLEYAILDGVKAADLKGVEDWATIKAQAEVKDVEEGQFTAAPNGVLDEIAYDATQTGETDYFALAVHMKEDAGNEYQGDSITIDVKVFATQKDAEEDSFGDQYDAGANLPAIPGKFNITNLEELNQAMTVGGQGTVMNNIDGVSAELPEGKELVLNLNGSAFASATGNHSIKNNGTLTVSGGTINSAADASGSINNYGILYLNDMAFNVEGTPYVFHNRGGETVMENCTFKAQRGGINVQSGKVTINEGCIVETDGLSNSVGYAVYAASNDSSEVIINGGEFIYNQKYTKFSMIYAGQNASVVINGGTFGKGGSGHKSGGWIRTAYGGTVTIYGGSFEFDPSNWVAEGYEAVKGTDGWWTVSKIVG